jgi:hypothetical protein
MGKKKVATNIPEELLRDAMMATGLNQTKTIIEGLRELIARERRRELLDLRGKLDLNLDIDKLRERKKVRK